MESRDYSPEHIREWARQGGGVFMCEDMSPGVCSLYGSCGPEKGAADGCPVAWRRVGGNIEWWSLPRGSDGKTHCMCSEQETE